MAKTNNYHFITHWRVEATCQQVCDILSDADGLKRWWPSVYLDVKTTASGNEKGIGKTVWLYTKGWLPYTLKWQFDVTASDEPNGYEIEAYGDFQGRGIWTFEQDGKYCNITYDWKISAEKGMLKHLSFIMKPIFSMNHLWAMRKGEESLKLELMRKAKMHNIPEAPGPTWPHKRWREQGLS